MGLELSSSACDIVRGEIETERNFIYLELHGGKGKTCTCKLPSTKCHQNPFFKYLSFADLPLYHLVQSREAHLIL